MSTTQSVRDRVVELLNQAAFLSSEKERISTLSQVQELVVHNQPELLDSFYEEIVAFLNDSNADVRKWVVGFIEDACRKDERMLPLLLPNIQLLLQDSAVSVVKRCVQSTAPLHKLTLISISQAHSVTPDMELAWIILTGIKAKIISLIDHDNDGVRTQTIKCLESLVLAQSYSEQSSQHRDGSSKEASFCLDQVPLTLKLFRPRKLEEEAKDIVNKLVSFLGSIHISSVNLMTCMSSLAIIARARPMFLSTVVPALQLLIGNLPPTLSKSQVNSVRKHMRMQLLNLFKHPNAGDHYEVINNVLTSDLGMTEGEIKKAVPNIDEMRRVAKKRERSKAAAMKKEDEEEVSKKRARLQGSSSHVSGNRSHKPSSKSITESKENFDKRAVAEQADQFSGTSLIDLTAKWLFNKLSIESVSELVMESMLLLPPSMPGVFSAGYTPVSGAGTVQQKQQLARMLAAQLVAADYLPPHLALAKQQNLIAEAAEKAKQAVFQGLGGDSDDEGPLVSYVGARLVPQNQVALPSPVLPPIRHKIAAVKLAEVTPMLSGAEQGLLQHSILRRLLRTTRLPIMRRKEADLGRLIVANCLAIASDEEIQAVEEDLLANLSQNLDVIELWIYSLYAKTNDFSQFSRLSSLSPTNTQHGYESVLLRTVRAAVPLCIDKDTRDKLSHLLLTCPSLSESVVTTLVDGTVWQGNAASVMVQSMAPLLRDIALWRGAVATHAAKLLCSLALHELQAVREAVLAEIEAILLGGGSLADTIVTCAQQHLLLLMTPQPPPELFSERVGRSLLKQDWDEDTIQACLYLPLAIMPLQQSLIHDLATVYIKTVNDAKRSILRLLEQPVSLIGMESQQLLALVRSTPKGSETLITRIIHVLTEKAPPSEALVCQVRELYNRRVSDVRFLIPVLTGLSKKEVVAVLPKLIRLNPHVVKEVFNRLWGVTLDTGTSPLTPVELLVALHLIEVDKCDVKIVIKATGLCFQERSVYTAEVVAAALQQLLQETEPPTLLMRTVIMALTHHPQLLTFIVTVLITLIDKQVWQYPKIWEGFIKCCERAAPQSMEVLLQLPALQLQNIFKVSTSLKDALTRHIKSFTSHQRSHLASEVLALVGLAEEDDATPSSGDDAVVPHSGERTASTEATL